MQLEFKVDPALIWQSMLEDCRAATHTIELENFIFIDSGIGREFLEVFRAKVKEGVRVRLLLDMYGSRGLYLDGERLLELDRWGIEIKFFNTISMWRLDGLTHWLSRRNHRKFLLVDDRIAHIGSANVDERMRNWSETSARLEGPEVASLLATFNTLWLSAMRAKLSRKVYKIGFSSELHYLSSTPHLGKRKIHKTLLKKIRRAKRSINLITPYFVPTERILRALIRALAHGVRVTLLVTNSPETSKILNLANSEYGRVLIRHGARVYRMEEKYMHDKFFIIDDSWAMMGSANLDNLSLLSDYEHVLVGVSKEFVLPLIEQYINLQQRASELPLAATRREKILGLLIRPIHRFL